MSDIKTYSELISIPNFLDRFRYLKLDGLVGEETFGFERYLNQRFYHSPEWKKLRRDIILRDNGCDLACEGYELQGKIYIHHLNPITADDIHHSSDYLLDPEYLISTSFDTHKAIHYGDEMLLITEPIERYPDDTKLW